MGLGDGEKVVVPATVDRQRDEFVSVGFVGVAVVEDDGLVAWHGRLLHCDVTVYASRVYSLQSYLEYYLCEYPQTNDLD